MSGTNSLVAKVSDGAGNTGTSNTVTLNFTLIPGGWGDPTGGLWSDPSTWSSGSAPTSTSDVVFDPIGTTPYVVTIASGTSVSVNSITLDDPNITLVDAGSLSITTSLIETAGAFEISGGTLSLGGGSSLLINFEGLGGTLTFGSSPGFTGTIDAISTASGPVTISGGGAVTTTFGDAIDLVASGGSQSNPANLAISLTGAITGAANGISAIQNGFGAVSISTSGPVIGKAGRGIFVEESATGTGDILINGSGSVTGTGIGFSGIVAENLDATSNGNITVSQTGNVSGGHDAIRVQANGTGNIIVTTGANANITGTSLYGIETQSNGAGSITVTTASGDVITSAGAGINAYNHATAIPQTGGMTTSTMSVSAGGIINSGVVLNGNSSRPAGILVGYQGGPTNNINPNVFGNVTVDNFATINAAGGDGIRAYNFGSGNVSVTDHANTTIAAPDVFGIVAQTNGAGNTSVTTSAGDIINSGSAGILSINSAAAASANSTVSVTANGTINSGVHLTPGGSQPYAIGAGYNGANGTPNAAINGSVSIDNFANLTAAAGWGIDAFNVGNGSITLTDEASTAVSGAQYGIAAYSLGPGSAAVTGGVTISVGSNATIIADALYGLAGINAVENNAGSIADYDVGRRPDPVRRHRHTGGQFCHQHVLKSIKQYQDHHGVGGTSIPASTSHLAEERQVEFGLAMAPAR